MCARYIKGPVNPPVQSQSKKHGASDSQGIASVTLKAAFLLGRILICFEKTLSRLMIDLRIG